MKILHVGAGTIGTAATAALTGRGHEVITAHRSSSSHPVDITDATSIARLVEQVGAVDAVISSAGSAPFGAWDELGPDAWLEGLTNKLLGQVELVRAAAPTLDPGGSFTLISGILSREPIRGSSVSSAVNAALEAFVRSVAAEARDRFRINVVSPTVLTESAEKYATAFPGFPTVDGSLVGAAYVRSVESFETGRVYAV